MGMDGLQPGQRVDLRLRSYPDRIFSGTLNWLSTQLDEETRTARVRAVIDNPDGTLRDGMFGTASIENADVRRLLDRRTVFSIPY